MPFIIALLLLIGGGTTSVLAQNSLPGDSLYPVKIHINENIESILAFTEKSDAQVNVKQASRRLKEAETLASSGRLSVELNTEIKDSFSKEVNSLEKHLARLDQDGATSTAKKIHDDFKGEIYAHYASLRSASSTDSVDDLLLLLEQNDKFDYGYEKDDDNSEIADKFSRSYNSRKSDLDDDEESDDDDMSVTTKTTKSAQSTQTTQTQQIQQISKSYTLAEVAQHNNAQSCYTIVSNTVYDVTTWINQHPGGSGAIVGMCGIDATAAYDGQHGGKARPASELATFKIGVLK